MLHNKQEGISQRSLKAVKEKFTIEKRIVIIMGSIFILSLVPLLIIAFYNVMCADDYSYGLLARRAYMESHSLLNCLKAAMQQVHSSYFSWQGTYSAIFFMALQPGIFSEQVYFLTTYIILFFFIGGTIYFSRVLFREWLKINNSLIIIIVSIFFMLAIQWMPVPSEGLYWYNGSIFYMGFHGIMMFYFGLLIKGIISEKRNKFVIAAALFVGFILGGGNYVTALLTLELSFLLILACWKNKKDRTVGVILPVAINGIGFLVSVMAPGNQIRQQYFLDTKLDVVRSVLYSFRSGIKYINNWMNVWIVLGLALLVPFVWKVVIKISCEWKYPGGVIILSFCIFSSSFTPTLYAQGFEGAGRVQNIQYVYFIIMLFVNLFYLEGWVSRRLKIQLAMGEKILWRYVLSVIICFGVSLIFMPDKENVISYSAMRSLFVGGARQEYINRRQMKELLF